MASILKISDGTTTVDFVTDAAYRLLEWSPAVATRRKNTIGGHSPYGDVVEEMKIFIGGASVLSKLSTLEKLIDQAEQWALGAEVAAVSLHVKLTAGSQELKAVIYGPPARGEPAIELPPRFTDAAVVTAIDGAVLRFRRAGLWLAPDDNGSVPSTAANPTTATSLLTGTSQADSPFELVLSNLPWNESVVWNSFVLATCADTTANAAKKLVIVEAETMSAGVGGTTSVNDSTNKARGNNVLRFTFSGAGNLDSLPVDVSASVHTAARRWAVFISCRNNSASVSFNVRAGIASGNRYAMGRPVTVAAGANSNQPFWLYLGQLSLRQALKWVFLNVTADGAATIDFDSMALLAVDNPDRSRALAILADASASAGETFSSARGLQINHALDFDLRPHVYFVNGANILFQNYSGNAAMFVGADEPAVACAWLACGRWNGAYWRATDSAGTVVSTTIGTTRNKGQLTLT